MEAIIINPDRVSTVKTAKNMVEIGTCEVCDSPILVASWVAKILGDLDRKVTTCSRKCSNLKQGNITGDMDELDEDVM